LKEERCIFNLYTDRGVYTNQQMDELGETRFRSYFSDCGCKVVIATDAEIFAESEPCLKFLVKQTNILEGYERIRKAIEAIPGLYLTSSAADNMEIMLSSAGKAVAVKKLAKILQISLENVAAFGDFDNDVEMLIACGFSVAMDNAVEAAKNAARFITKHHDEAGVGYAIQALIKGRQDLLKKSE
jgi:Cof subfamily protein (haloacid dehalogenase superfamily)